MTNNSPLTTFEFQSFLVNYHIEGSGLPLVLLHGFGESSDVWQQQVTELQHHAQVIVMDFPGSGLSTIPQSKFTEENIELLSQIPFYADVVRALLSHLQLPKAIVLGHSMGGYVALAFAEKYPELLLGFGLIHSTAFADSEEKKANRQRGIGLMEQYSGYDFLKNSIPNLFTDAFKKTQPNQVEALIDAARNFEKKPLQCYYRAMMNRPDTTHLLKTATVPVMIVAGGEDKVVPLTDLLQQAHMPNECHFHILPHAAHMGMWEATPLMNEAIKAFLSYDL